ncbi:hypothetical protein CEP54_005988 [Fusarium duplospermum]|uniref:Uncharacterized protein n=1 Tax=Fusarium duplospermum TaxID=1325734 RepID=A0A428Q9E7_9HYPO|nr:hypothetical protein CEP54_005988 [Fusarium duplospermum]
MGLLASNTLRLLLGLIITVSLIAFLSPSSVPAVKIPDSIPFRMPAALRGLEVSLEQTEKSPPTLVVTVKNNNEGPVTLLTYGSPLDPLAPQLGMLYITPEAETKPLEITQLEVQRQWPPADDAVVEIAAGDKKEHELTLMEPVIPMDLVFGKATVQLRGKWQAVWPTEKNAVNQTALEAGGAGEDALTGSFESNIIDIATD